MRDAAFVRIGALSLALIAARRLLREERRNLLENFCELDGLGRPIRSTLDTDDGRLVHRYDRVIDKINTALR